MAHLPLKLLLCLALGTVPQAGCATIIGTAISPVTGPVEVVGLLADGTLGGFWEAAWKTPVLLLCSPLVGFLTGLGVDVEVIDHMRWPLWKVLQPFYNLPGH